jgi:hypothetical protein
VSRTAVGAGCTLSREGLQLTNTYLLFLAGDTCFTHLHRAGQLKYHHWTPLTVMCEMCHNYTAFLNCKPCATKLCRRCGPAHTQVGAHTATLLSMCPRSVRLTCLLAPTQSPGLHALKTMRFKPKGMLAYDAEQEAVRAKERMEVEYKHFRLHMADRRLQRAAMAIHRTWRGYIARKPILALLGTAEARRNRAADDAVRMTLAYRVSRWLVCSRGRHLRNGKHGMVRHNQPSMCACARV